MPPPPIKILIVAPPNLGGITEHISQLISGLNEDRFHLSLACTPNSRLVDHAISLGIQIYPLSFRSLRSGRSLPLFAASKIRRLLRREQPDILHLHSWSGFAAGALASTLLFNRPYYLLCTLHSFPNGASASLAKRVGRTCDKIICVSNALGQLFSSFPSDKVAVIANGVSPHDISAANGNLKTQLGLTKTTPVVGLVSRLVPQKGIEFLLEAATRIKEVHFLIIGDGPLRDELESRSAKLLLAKRVHFLGRVPDARALLSAVDIFALPSLSEGSSLVAMEAMAAGLPVVASRLDPLEEIIVEGETGLLVPPADSEALTDALKRLIQNPVLRHRMGEAGKNRFQQNFTAAQMLQNTAAVYETLLDRS